MSAEFWAILGVGVTLLGVGVSLGLLLYQFTGGLRGEMSEFRGEIRDIRGEVGGLRSEMSEFRGEIADLRERMARLEGLFEGYVRGDSKAPAGSP